METTEFHITKHPTFVEVEMDGMAVNISRSSIDGSLHVEIDTSEVGLRDQHPATGVPRLSLAINDCSQQLDADGQWVDRAGYEPITVLDHLAAS
jgi:hypothetical protein